MATKKRKTTTAIVAGVTAAALLLGGTFAWQSINQTALNEASDVINPGGRLHDDFDGSNKDIYVENFADEDIFARIQLSEYFAIIANYGKEGAQTKTDIAGTATLDENGNIVDPEYVIHYFGEDANNLTDEYWNWATGGSSVFMPTFNLNKDSLVADINGTYVDAIGGISNRDGSQYTDYKEYEVDETEEGTEIYDGDTDTEDEVGTDFDDLDTYVQAGDIVTVSQDADGNAITHTAKETGTATLISMADWLALIEQNGGEYDADLHGEYWVYDTDGWVYWSAPIAPDTATGLLLDGIELNGVMDDTWYYAINVVAQFVTADDVGKTDNTGFYATTSGTVPTGDAETLLGLIGVEMDGEAGGDDDIVVEPVYDIAVSSDEEGWDFYGDNYAAPGSTYNLQLTKDGEPVEATSWDLTLIDSGSYNYNNDLSADTKVENGVLTIAADEVSGSYSDYHVIEVTADDADGNTYSRYFVINDSGLRIDIAYYDTETGAEVVYDNLLLNKTYRMSVIIQEATTNAYVTQYCDPIIVDSDVNIQFGENVWESDDAVEPTWKPDTRNVSVEDGILKVTEAGTYKYTFEDPSMGASYWGSSFTVSGISTDHSASLYQNKYDSDAGDWVNVELTSLATGTTYSNLNVMLGGEMKSVTGVQLSGGNSTGTKAEYSSVLVGYFETAENLTLLVFVDGETNALQFTLPVTQGETLTDISDTYTMARTNGSDNDPIMVYSSDNYIYGGIRCENYIVPIEGFEEFETTLSQSGYLTSLYSYEIVGPYADEYAHIEMTEDHFTFRSSEEPISDTHTLYAIVEMEQEDGSTVLSYVVREFKSDYEGE